MRACVCVFVCARVYENREREKWMFRAAVSFFPIHAHVPLVWNRDTGARVNRRLHIINIIKKISKILKGNSYVGKPALSDSNIPQSVCNSCCTVVACEKLVRWPEFGWTLHATTNVIHKQVISRLNHTHCFLNKTAGFEEGRRTNYSKWCSSRICFYSSH